MISNELLKKKILDEAIHGRLVENDPSLKPIDVRSINDDIPFEIPNNWKWIRFGDLVKDCYQGINTAGDKVEFVEEDGVPIIQVGDMTSGIININNTKLMSYEDYDYYKDKYQPKYNDIFYCNIGTIGYPLIYRENYKMLFHWNIFDIKYNEKYSDVVFLKWCLEYYTDIFKNMTSGSAMKFVSKKKLLDTLFPVPPLEEQYKIANKIEELFELIDKKEKNDKEKEKLKTLLKEKILDSAIHGNLVENDLTLPTIDVEEIKKDVPFDIPNNWKWSMFKDVFNIVNGFTPLRTNDDFWNSNDIPWFTVDDIKSQGHIINKTNQFITKKALGKNVNRLIPKNTVLLCCTSATIGNYALTNIELTTNQQWNALILNERMNKQIVVKYIYYYVQTLRKKMLIDGNSTTFPFISLKKLGDYLIPIPPLEQQKKIVEKIEECFKLIEQL